jgi:hypothetical protein
MKQFHWSGSYHQTGVKHQFVKHSKTNSLVQKLSPSLLAIAIALLGLLASVAVQEREAQMQEQRVEVGR